MRELERDFPTPRAVRESSLPSLAIVGAGRVGGSLALAAERAGLEFRLASHQDALDASRKAEVALLCVPDAAIASTAEEIAAAVPPLRSVGHVSGATQLTALEACRARGASVFSLHPLQTVPDAETDLTDAPCAIAGSDSGALELAGELARRLGMEPFEIAEEDRAAYHAAAAIASNFLVALEQSAAELLGRAGVDDARRLLAPLVLRSAANWAERGSEALTGPIARGDEATIARHLEALERLAPELIPVYEALAERTAELAGSRGAERRRLEVR